MPALSLILPFIRFNALGDVRQSGCSADLFDQDDVITGQGKFTYASGASYEGQWENGVYQVGACMQHKERL